jgi:hypothetical protein
VKNKFSSVSNGIDFAVIDIWKYYRWRV